MSQNGPYSGPPWSHGSSDEPYAEPADPWGDPAAQPEQSGSWGGHPPSIPQQPVSFHSAPMNPVSSGGSSSWDRAPVPPPKRNTPIIALVVTLGVLIVIGLGTTAWLLSKRADDQRQQQASPDPAASELLTGPAPQGSDDARFYVKKGDCVINEGDDNEPNMRAAPCTTGTYEVLARFEGKATGEKDAERKCAKVTGYTKWFFYDSALDDLDFVLCLKEHKANG